MREIIFRGKSVDNGEWVYGFLRCGNYIDVWTPHTWKEDDGSTGEYATVETYQVEPKTVGEHTGLTDKNGKKIFEGDILRGFNYPFRDGEGNHNYYAEVVWFKNSSAFGLVTHKNPKSDVVGISEGNCEYMEDWEAFLWEVIGNIYDNKELLND